MERRPKRDQLEDIVRNRHGFSQNGKNLPIKDTQCILLNTLYENRGDQVSYSLLLESIGRPRLTGEDLAKVSALKPVHNLQQLMRPLFVAIGSHWIENIRGYGYGLLTRDKMLAEVTAKWPDLFHGSLSSIQETRNSFVSSSPRDVIPITPPSGQLPRSEFNSDVEPRHQMDVGVRAARKLQTKEQRSITAQTQINTPKERARSFTSNLPRVNPMLIGRKGELLLLEDAWNNPKTNFIQVTAEGGTGKTALIDKWFRRHVDETPIFAWSFYSQGSSTDRQTSSYFFFRDFVSWLGIEIPLTASIYGKAEAIADYLRRNRILLILDGIEPLQNRTGALLDKALKAFLLELATANSGLVICTTRVAMEFYDDDQRVLSLPLDNLTPDESVEYLRALNVSGTAAALRKAAAAYWNNALALTLLGTYLAAFCEGKVHRRIQIPPLITHGGSNANRAFRMIAGYEKLLNGTTEHKILLALGYFDRPADPEALALIVPSIRDRDHQYALKQLCDLRLILSTDIGQSIDCHPLVREYFALKTTPEGTADSATTMPGWHPKNRMRFQTWCLFSKPFTMAVVPGAIRKFWITFIVLAFAGTRKHTSPRNSAHLMSTFLYWQISSQYLLLNP